MVLASSAKEHEAEHFGAHKLADSWTTSSADVEATKPAPDLVEVARRST